MRTACDLFRGAALAALLAALSPLLPLAPASAEGLGVAPAVHARALAPLAPGFDRWLAVALDRAGRPALALPVSGPAGLERAADLGLEHVLAPRLAGGDGRIAVRFALHAAATGEVVDTHGAEGPLADLEELCAEALGGLAPSLGIEAAAIAGPRASELASATRSLTLLDQGRLYAAWEGLEGGSSGLAEATRREIAERAKRPGGSRDESARVIAASGDPGSAWGLVGSKAMLELRKQKPDVGLLLSAAEIQLSRENPRQALRFLEKAVAHAPRSAEVQRVLARAHTARGDRAAARQALERAAALDPEDTRALRALIGLDAGGSGLDPDRRIEAAARLAALYQDEPARRLLAIPGPGSEARAALALGDLEARMGRHAEARAAYARALERGGERAAPLLGMGRAELAMGDHAAAERALRRAVTLEPENPAALTALGTVLTRTERAEEAVPLLHKAHSLAPEELGVKLTYAHALRVTGSPSDAVALLSDADRTDTRMLHELARSQRAAGDAAGAEATMREAVRLAPDDPELRVRQAEMLGRPGGGGDALESAELAVEEASEASAERRARRVEFDAVAVSFANSLPGRGRRSLAYLGLREPGDWKSWLRRITRLQEPSRGAIEAALRDAFADHFGSVDRSGAGRGPIAGRVDQLFDFDDRRSLSAEAIASVNTVLRSDGVFVTRLLSHPEDRAELACAPESFAVETRLLLGAAPDYVEILASTDCVARGLADYTAWNVEAFVGAALILLFVVFPLVRGWGTIVVTIQLPEKTKGFLSIHVTKKPDQVRRDVIDKKTGREKIRAKRRIDLLRRFSRHMVGRETVMRWIPARSAEYTVTLGGPLLDARGEQVVGFFLEEQPARVRRGATTKLEYDFRPKECAIEVKVTLGGEPAPEARVAIAGVPDSLRYVRDGMAFLYVGQGEYTVLIGSKEAVAEFRVLVEKLDAAVPLAVDLMECDAVFRDCPGAVEPYLIGDLATAAAALEGAGHEAAPRVRAELYERQGRAADAAVELEAAGDLGHAAELRAEAADHGRSAALYEEAGDHANAAAAHRAAGAWEDAARCYELIYDYGNALECWREVGDEARELDLLEKLGEYQDAAQIAHEMGDVDRAIHNLQQVDQRHVDYPTVCRRIAEIVSERGDHELAVAKFEEALGPDGLQSASLDVLESYAAILERAGRRDLAISAYETIQRRDVARTDLSARIQALRAEAASESETDATRALPGGGATPAPAESRYELLDEIGRGGMGVVYKARDKRLGRIVALKRLPENLRDHPTAVALFEREARAAAALNHQNIVTLFDAGEEDGAYFITMELLEGRPLNDILARNGRISARDTARLGVQIAAGMHYAHERRIVHRDIKTANLFFTNDQVVKIMDFGIAKSLEEVRRSTTVVGGTPYYMAPEQARGQGVDHRADLYAFGVTLFQLVTGSLPFTDGDVGYLHAHEPPPDPREIQVDVPDAMAALVLAMMAKQPDDRPESAAAVADSLREILASYG